jgi:hypothetical protein
LVRRGGGVTDLAAADFVGRAAFAAGFFTGALRGFVALLALALAGLRTVLVALRVAVAARVLLRVGRAFVALALPVFAAVVRAARATALALRDFSVFLTDDIRAHSFYVSPGGETQVMQQRQLCRLGKTAADDAPRYGQAEDHPSTAARTSAPRQCYV